MDDHICDWKLVTIFMIYASFEVALKDNSLFRNLKVAQTYNSKLRDNLIHINFRESSLPLVELGFVDHNILKLAHVPF